MDNFNMRNMMRRIFVLGEIKEKLVVALLYDFFKEKAKIHPPPVAQRMRQDSNGDNQSLFTACTSKWHCCSELLMCVELSHTITRVRKEEEET